MVGPPDSTDIKADSSEAAAGSDSKKRLSYGRPVLEATPKTMSLEEYMKSKSKQQMSGHTFRQSKKRKVSDKQETVTINIGLMKIVSDDLKPVWGRRLPIVVAKNSNYRSILEKAVEKYKAFDRKFDAEQEHVLVYEDGSHAQLMPGGKSFFQLDNYKTEVGKDFKRITLYLCTEDDLNISQSLISRPESESPRSPDPFVYNEDPCTIEDVFDDEKVAQDLQKQFDLESQAQHSPMLPISVHPTTSTESAPVQLMKPEDVVKELKKKVITDEADSFFLVIQREISLPRLLSLWQRRVKKTPATRILRVRIIGEDGIDSGAIGKEFLQTSIKSIGENMFPDGIPLDSTLHVQNGNYRTCGQIVAVSLAQGGPPPFFLDPAAFDMMAEDVNIHSIKETDLAEKEQRLLKQIELSCNENMDIILEHGYTGPVNQEHLDVIIASVKVFSDILRHGVTEFLRSFVHHIFISYTVYYCV